MIQVEKSLKAPRPAKIIVIRKQCRRTCPTAAFFFDCHQTFSPSGIFKSLGSQQALTCGSAGSSAFNRNQLSVTSNSGRTGYPSLAPYLFSCQLVLLKLACLVGMGTGQAVDTAVIQDNSCYCTSTLPRKFFGRWWIFSISTLLSNCGIFSIVPHNLCPWFSL